MKCENAEVTAGNGAEDFAITKDGIVIASSGLMYPIFQGFRMINNLLLLILNLEERRIGKMVMLDTKNPAAKPVELTLTNLPSNFKFTPMGIG